MTYTIKEISEKVNLTPYTLRYYEKEGLLPSVDRGSNGQRLFNDADIKWLNLICCMRSTGMSVSDIRRYVELCAEGEKTVEERRNIIVRQKELLEERLREVKGYLTQINMKLSIYDEMISKKRTDVLNPYNNK